LDLYQLLVYQLKLSELQLSLFGLLLHLEIQKRLEFTQSAFKLLGFFTVSQTLHKALNLTPLTVHELFVFNKHSNPVKFDRFKSK